MPASWSELSNAFSNPIEAVEAAHDRSNAHENSRPAVGSEINETGHLLGYEAAIPPQHIAGDSCRGEGAKKSKPGRRPGAT
jgi:hypothetical protein